MTPPDDTIAPTTAASTTPEERAEHVAAAERIDRLMQTRPAPWRDGCVSVAATFLLRLLAERDALEQRATAAEQRARAVEVEENLRAEAAERAAERCVGARPGAAGEDVYMRDPAYPADTFVALARGLSQADADVLTAGVRVVVTNAIECALAGERRRATAAEAELECIASALELAKVPASRMVYGEPRSGGFEEINDWERIAMLAADRDAARAEVARLREAVAALEDRLEAAVRRGDERDLDVAEQFAEVARLREAIVRNGLHTSRCEMSWKGGDCTCWINAALAKGGG